jgi:hypothetical protein
MPVPPTITQLQSQGVAGAWVTCCNPNCLCSTPVTFEAIKLAPETPFPNIARLKRFVCSACGSGRVDVLPDWRGHEAFGDCKAMSKIRQPRREFHTGRANDGSVRHFRY